MAIPRQDCRIAAEKREHQNTQAISVPTAESERYQLMSRLQLNRLSTARLAGKGIFPRIPFEADWPTPEKTCNRGTRPISPSSGKIRYVRVKMHLRSGWLVRDVRDDKIHPTPTAYHAKGCPKNWKVFTMHF